MKQVAELDKKVSLQVKKDILAVLRECYEENKALTLEDLATSKWMHVRFMLSMYETAANAVLVSSRTQTRKQLKRDLDAYILRDCKAEDLTMCRPTIYRYSNRIYRYIYVKYKRSPSIEAQVRHAKTKITQQKAQERAAEKEKERDDAKERIQEQQDISIQPTDQVI